jgi:hypothetical protein
MSLPNGHARGSAGKRELCHTLAETAAVTTTFDVIPDSGVTPQRRLATDSFSEALDLLSPARPGSILVRFKWVVGRRSGRSQIEYSNVSLPMATARYATQVIRNRIKKEIAAQLLREPLHGYQ